MINNASTITSTFPEKMGVTAPVEVGTRGTVGSLVMKEIEYFKRLELDHPGGSSIKNQKHYVNMASSGRSSWRSFGFLMMTWRRKKRRVSGGFLPGVCSLAEVADSHRLNGVPEFSYKNLKDDTKEYEAQFQQAAPQS